MAYRVICIKGDHTAFFTSQKQLPYKWSNEQIMISSSSLPYFNMAHTTLSACLVPYSNPPTIIYPMWCVALAAIVGITTIFGSLRFICGSATNIFHLWMSRLQNGFGSLAYSKHATMVVPVVATRWCTPSTESGIMYSFTASACSSSSGGPHASGQVWP